MIEVAMPINAGRHGMPLLALWRASGCQLLLLVPAMAQGAKHPARRRRSTSAMSPGAISTEEAVISEGPFARQIVFFPVQ